MHINTCPISASSTTISPLLNTIVQFLSQCQAVVGRKVVCRLDLSLLIYHQKNQFRVMLFPNQEYESCIPLLAAIFLVPDSFPSPANS